MPSPRDAARDAAAAARGGPLLPRPGAVVLQDAVRRRRASCSMQTRCRRWCRWSSAGIGVTLIPEMAVSVETRSASVSVARFKRPQPSRTIGMVWRKTSPLARQLHADLRCRVPGSRPQAAQGGIGVGAQVAGLKGRAPCRQSPASSSLRVHRHQPIPQAMFRSFAAVTILVSCFTAAGWAQTPSNSRYAGGNSARQAHRKESSAEGEGCP